MKKILLFLSLFAATCTLSFAQSSSTGTRASIGAEIGIPVGEANQVYNLTEGVSLKIEAPLTQRGLNFTVTAGITNFSVSSNYSGFIQNAQYVPITVGIKNYFQDSPVFLEAAAGISININSNYSASSTAFLYAPALGVSVANNALDISMRYEGRVETGGTVAQLALRVAYKFGGK